MIFRKTSSVFLLSPCQAINKAENITSDVVHMSTNHKKVKCACTQVSQSENSILDVVPTPANPRTVFWMLCPRQPIREQYSGCCAYVTNDNAWCKSCPQSCPACGRGRDVEARGWNCGLLEKSQKLEQWWPKGWTFYRKVRST